MAILEIAQVWFKKEPAIIRDVKEELVPSLIKLLSKSEPKNGLFGYVVTENGRDVREDNRLILLLEWDAVENFKNFVASSGFLEFAGKLKESAAPGSAPPKLFDVDNGVSSLFTSDTVLEYLVIKPKDASEASAKSILEKIQSKIPQPGTAQVVVGKGIVNTETGEIALVSLYASEADLAATSASAARVQLLADIADTVDVTTTLIAHVKKELPLAEK
ncbi:hypothetical protein F5Y03DRAFT_246697 [Xylaria venustula]|nr:hypothetical protein F5Y03DRAFT_246697 [Xylaria venustula]